MRVIVLLFLQLSASAVFADPKLWQTLASEPNMVVLMRHAPAGGGNGSIYDRSGKCRGERMLTANGQRLAVKIGAEFASYKIMPKVITSPLCRARETARLAFRKFEIEPALREIASADAAGVQDFESAAKRLALKYRAKQPLVMITHQPNIEVLSFELLEPGEAVVGRINDNGEIETLGRISLVNNR